MFSKAECYNCGKVGHYAIDCESKKTSTHADTYSKAAKYKAKYKAMKAECKERKKPEVKSLIAESHEWDDNTSSSSSSSDSEDDEKSRYGRCLMAKEEVEEKKISTFLADIREADEKAQSADWRASLMYKVENFRTYTDDEKAEMFDFLRVDLDMACKREMEFRETLEDLKTQLNLSKSENKILMEEKLELESQVYAASIHLQESADLKNQLTNLKKIVESWCHSAQRTAKCVQEQIPHQVKAILGGDYEAAAAMAEITMMDPVLEEPTILPETFAKVVGGKKVFTNKFVKPSIPVVSMTKIMKETKAEGSSNSTNELTNPSVLISTSDSPVKPKANQPKASKADNTAKPKAVLTPAADGCETSKAGEAKREQALNPRKKVEPSNASTRNKPRNPKGKQVQAELTETQILSNKLDQLATQVQQLCVYNTQQLNKSNTPMQAASTPAQPKPKNRKCYNCGGRSHMSHQCKAEYCMVPRTLLNQWASQTVPNPFISNVPTKRNPRTSKTDVNPPEPIQGWVPKMN